MGHDVYYYANEFKKASERITKTERKVNNESKSSSTSLAIDILAALHIVTLYRGQFIAHHRDKAIQFEKYLTCFAVGHQKLTDVLEEDVYARMIFTNIIADKNDIDLEEKLSPETKEKLRHKTVIQAAGPSTDVRNKFLATVLTDIIDDTNFKYHHSSFASLCLILSSNLKLPIHQTTKGKLIVSADYSKGFWDCSANERRMHDLMIPAPQPSRAKNTEEGQARNPAPK